MDIRCSSGVYIYIFWFTCIIFVSHFTVIGSTFMGSKVSIIKSRNKGTDAKQQASHQGKEKPTYFENVEFQPLPYPVNFHFYDVNRDGLIEIHELIHVTGVAEEVENAFAASDENGDGFVSEVEYDRIPWGYDDKKKFIQT